MYKPSAMWCITEAAPHTSEFFGNAALFSMAWGRLWYRNPLCPVQAVMKCSVCVDSTAAATPIPSGLDLSRADRRVHMLQTGFCCWVWYRLETINKNSSSDNTGLSSLIDCLTMYLCLSVSGCLSDCLIECLSVNMTVSIFLSVCPTFCLYIYLCLTAR